MKKIVLIFLFFLGLKTVGFSQEKLSHAALPPVSESGFYKIDLRPEILSRTQADFADLRILDWKNREVPYLLQRNAPETVQKNFREYPVVSKSLQPKAHTILVLRNPNRNKISNLSLVIKNTNVSKKADLSGSADGQTWYALEDDYLLQSVTNPEETSEVKVLHFPLSDYEFYKLEINDSASAPLNILAAGYYDFNAEKGQYATIPNLWIKRTDSTEVKRTYLHVSAGAPVLIDKLEFKIDSTTFYLRNTTVFIKQTHYGKRNRRTEAWSPVHSFSLRSDSKNSFQLPGFRAQEFLIEIDNADNPPLEINGVDAYQLKTFLVSELKKDRNYTLQFGNEKLLAPAYDLAFFKDKIPADLPVLEPLTVTVSADKVTTESSVNRFFQSELLIWIAMLAVIIFLGYMTYKMLQEQSTSR